MGLQGNSYRTRCGRGAIALAVTMQLDAVFPLTLTLSLREREQLVPGRDCPPVGGHSSARSNMLPLPKG